MTDTKELIEGGASYTLAKIRDGEHWYWVAGDLWVSSSTMAALFCSHEAAKMQVEFMGLKDWIVTQVSPAHLRWRLEGLGECDG